MVNMWMVRAGERAFLIDEFIEKNIVAIGWDLGDLSDKSDDEIRELYKKKYKNLKSLYQVLRFKNEINIGDYVLSAKGSTRTYFIGKIKSDYKRSHLITQKDSSGDNYFDIREVEWLGEVQRDSLKKPTQKIVGENNTVFKIDDNAKEDVLKVCRDNMDAIEHAGCIIRNHLDENGISDFRNDDEEKLFAKFQSKFSPEILKNLEGSDILYTIFPQKGNESTLTYALEFSNDFKWLCGGIRGGSNFKFSLFKYGKTGKWTVGSAVSNLKSISEDKAIEIAILIRDAIVKGAEYVQNHEFNSVSDYIQFEKELQELFKEPKKYCPISPNHTWIHKYYTLIFPEIFPIVHTDDKKSDSLLKFRIKPLDGFYAKDGQLYQLAKQSDIVLYSLFNKNIVELFFECDDYWKPISEGRLVELKECVGKTRGWREKRDVIYFGAPGTGKSYTLNQDKDNLLKNYGDNYERVTFHPDYSYANFVGTYKPIPENDSITYDYVPGPFMRILKKAIENPYKPYILIIEEINRANVAATFGDVFQLLDRNENNESLYPIDTTQDMKTYLNQDKIIIPQNMFIWATMNSADQGVFPMDTAFKRRWDFKYFSINNNQELIKDTYVKIGNNTLNWNDLRNAINHQLLSYKLNEDKLIGPFFAFNDYHNQEIPIDTFKDIFKNKIIMYLFEDAARPKRNELFSGACEIYDTKNITYSQICDLIDDDKIIEIFTQDIRDKFLPQED